MSTINTNTASNNANLLTTNTKTSNSSSATSATSNAATSDQAISTALGAGQSLSQSDFLQLLVTQVKNQDPTKPMDSTQFVSQLAQFSSLAGITSLNTTMTGVSQSMQSSQLLQGTALIGQQVLAPGNIAELTSTTPLAGSVTLPTATTGVTVSIADSSGNPVQTLNMGTQQAGQVAFSWDGTQSDGQQAPAGTYQVNATYLQDGKPVTATTSVAARVNSVALGSSGLMLDVQDLGQMSLSQVSMIM